LIDYHQLLLTYFIVCHCRLVDRLSPPKRGWAFTSSAVWSHLTRQSFDVGALTSPPLALSQHLSRSRAVPDCYRQCASNSARNKKSC